MLPTTDHLFWLRHDPQKFEAARSKLISEYIESLPEERRKGAYAMQCRIDVARETLSPQEFLQWMQRETKELAENLDDLFLSVQHKAEDLKKSLSQLGE